MADDTAPTTDEDRHVRPFSEWLVSMRGGVLHSELTDALNGLVQAVTTHGKKGELVLKVEIRPATKVGGDALVVTDDVIVKEPRGSRGEALFFHDGDFNLTRENPAQPRLPLAGVPTAPPAAADDDTDQEAAQT